MADEEKSRKHRTYWAFDMPNGMTYIGGNSPGRREALEDVIVTETVAHMSCLPESGVLDIAKYYKNIYLQVLKNLAPDALQSLINRNFRDKCIADWYLGEDILDL